MEKGFYQKVYDIVAQIPRGRVATYGHVALYAGNPKAARQVGFALRRAKEGLPCHRVVNRRGELAPSHVFGAKEYQRDLLEVEGIIFTTDGRVNLSMCLWKADD